MDVSITDKGRERLSLSMAKSTKLEMYGGWYVQIVVDGDNHLTVYLSNSDGTQVHDVGEDLSCEYMEKPEWGARFTTDGIEKEAN